MTGGGRVAGAAGASPAAPAALPHACWERQTSALPENVGELRRGIVAFAARHGVDGETQGAIAVACSEALTNAVLHAFIGRAAGTLTVMVESEPHALTCA